MLLNNKNELLIPYVNQLFLQNQLNQHDSNYNLTRNKNRSVSPITVKENDTNKIYSYNEINDGMNQICLKKRLLRNKGYYDSNSSTKLSLNNNSKTYNHSFNKNDSQSSSMGPLVNFIKRSKQQSRQKNQDQINFSYTTMTRQRNQLNNKTRINNSRKKSMNKVKKKMKDKNLFDCSNIGPEEHHINQIKYLKILKANVNKIESQHDDDLPIDTETRAFFEQ